jgi:hypothetical protein
MKNMTTAVMNREGAGMTATSTIMAAISKTDVIVHLFTGNVCM